MNANVKLAIQFLVTTEIFLFLVWLVHILVSDGKNMDAQTGEVVRAIAYSIIPLATGAVGYWIGSSASSQSKDQTVSRVAELAMFSRPTRPTTPPPADPATPPSSTTPPAQGG